MDDIFKVPAQPIPDDDDDTVDYDVLSFVAQFPGWVAYYDDPTDPTAVVARPICGLAHVEVTLETGGTQLVFRHLVSDFDGTISDVEDIDGFLCVAGPGVGEPDIKRLILAARAERARQRVE